MIAVIVVLLLSVMPGAVQAACGNGANYAGCAGPNGAAVYNKNTGQARSTGTSTVEPGTRYTGPAGNTATKGVVQGCGYVNGRRVCN